MMILFFSLKQSLIYRPVGRSHLGVGLITFFNTFFSFILKFMLPRLRRTGRRARLNNLFLIINLCLGLCLLRYMLLNNFIFNYKIYVTKGVACPTPLDPQTPGQALGTLRFRPRLRQGYAGHSSFSTTINKCLSFVRLVEKNSRQNAS